MVKPTTGLEFNAVLTDLSEQACDLCLSRDAVQQMPKCVSAFLCCIVCVCTCHCIRAPWNPNRTSAASLLHSMVLCLEPSRQDLCCSFSLGTGWRRQSLQKCSQFCSPSAIHPLHYELWFDPFSPCLWCSFIQHKPPQPPQDGKASLTVQQGSHEAIKHDQIKARHSTLGTEQELLYYVPAVLLKYEWWCLSRVPLIDLRVCRPLVRPSSLKYSLGLSNCHVCFVSTVLLSLFDVHLLAHNFGLLYHFEPHHCVTLL